MSPRVLPLTDAIALVTAALERCRTRADNAAVVARALVCAEADGLKGHGLVRVSSYAGQAKAGKVDGFAMPVTSRPAPGVLAIDAANGFAYPALDLAVAALPDIAREQGVVVARDPSLASLRCRRPSSRKACSIAGLWQCCSPTRRPR